MATTPLELLALELLALVELLAAVELLELPKMPEELVATLAVVELLEAPEVVVVLPPAPALVEPDVGPEALLDAPVPLTDTLPPQDASAATRVSKATNQALGQARMLRA
jgi:hypothetical protein